VSQLISVDNKEIKLSPYRSNLRSDCFPAEISISVYNIEQFLINQIIILGDIGSDGTELIKTHGSTAPTGNTVTLADALAIAHVKDSPVYISSFDKVEFSWSETLTGVKTVLATTDIDPAQDVIVYEDAVHTTGYSFTRLKNSITSVFSEYSDGVPYTGLPSNTVGYAIETAMKELSASFSERLTFEMLIGFSRQMLHLVRGKLRSWAKYQEYDYLIGTISQGVRSFPVPETLYDKNSSRSVLNLRVGDNFSLKYIDRSEYIEKISETTRTTVSTQAEIAATSLVLTDSNDMDDSGVVDVYVAGTKYAITYTANNRTTDTLTVGADQITAVLPVGSIVWQGMTAGTPEYYNISDGNIYIWPLASAAYAGRNLVMDFYTDIEDINSKMDVILGTKSDMLIPYLKFKIRSVLDNNGMENLNDPSYSEFRELLKDALANDASAEIESFRPRMRATRTERDNNLTRL